MRRKLACCVSLIVAFAAPAAEGQESSAEASVGGSADAALEAALAGKKQLEQERNRLLAQKRELEQKVAEAKAAARAAVEKLKNAPKAAEAAVKAKLEEAKREAKRRAEEAAERLFEATRVESDVFSFGIFPNTAGFMDARLHGRLRYFNVLSSGIYLDYTTARAVTETPTKSRSERLVREYRAEIDLVKGVIVPFANPSIAWSIEPGANGKAIYQDIGESGFNKNTFDETVFRSTDLGVLQLVTSLKLDSTLSVGKFLTVDLSGEYIPFIHQVESGTTVTSQFAAPVDFTITNRTSGFQLSVKAQLMTAIGGFALVGKAYRNEGKVASRSNLVAGNFRYEFETFDQAVREDYWVELSHLATTLSLFGRLTPSFALAYQRKRIENASDVLTADTFKLGFLLEWL